MPIIERYTQMKPTQSKQSKDGVTNHNARSKLDKKLVAEQRRIDWRIMQVIRKNGWGLPEYWQILDDRLAGVGRPITERQLIKEIKVSYCRAIAGSPYSDVLTDAEWELAATPRAGE